MYRIAQESLNNVAKHAKATSVSVLLENRDKFVVLILEDNGVGFNAGAKYKSNAMEKGVGLFGMKERAALIGGTMEIESTSGMPTVTSGYGPQFLVRNIDLRRWGSSQDA